MFKGLFAALCGALLGAAACGSNGSAGKSAVCAPGKTEACACIGGLTGGVQTCEDSGAAWGKCACPGDGSTDPVPNGSAGASAGHCTPGASEACVCSPKCDSFRGTHSCDTQGNWSACDGIVCQSARTDAPDCF